MSKDGFHYAPRLLETSTYVDDLLVDLRMIFVFSCNLLFVSRLCTTFSLTILNVDYQIINKRPV